MSTRAPGPRSTEAGGGPPRARGVASAVGAFCGFTTKGPTLALVSGWPDFVEKFGGFTPKSLMPTAVYIALNTGGQEAWISRVVADDAVASAGDLVTVISGRDTGLEGDASETEFSIDLGAYIKPGTLTLSVAATAATGSITCVAEASLVDGQTVTIGDGSTSVVFEFDLAGGDGVGGGNTPVVLSGTSTADQVAAALGAAIDASALNISVSGYGGVSAEVIELVHGATGTAGNVTITETVVNSGFIVSGMAGGRAVAVITDDGEGNLTGAGTGTIDYETGEIEVTFSTSPGAAPILADFVVWHFEFAVAWAGVAGDAISVRVSGNDDYYEYGTASWDRFDLEVIETVDGVERVLETFTALSFTDELDDNYVASVVNDSESGSEHIVVTSRYGGVPDSMIGQLVSGESVTMSPAYDGSEKHFTGELDYAPAPTTLTLTFTFGSPIGVSVVVDDADGGLEDGESAGTNRLSASRSSTHDGTQLDIYWTQAPASGSQVATYFTTPESSVVVAFEGGDDGAALTVDDITGARAATEEIGIYALNRERGVMTVVVPDFESDAEAISNVFSYIDGREDRAFVYAAPNGYSVSRIKAWARGTLSVTSKNATFFSPHVRIKDPITKRTLDMPPGAFFMGALASAHATAGVAQAPAGVDYGQVLRSIGLSQKFSEDDVAQLSSIGCNAIVDWKETGRVFLGAYLSKRTEDMEFINQRYVYLYIKESLRAGAWGFSFKNGGKGLRGQVRSYAEMFLLECWRKGLLKGATPAEAFYVLCDATNNPTDTATRADIGIATHKPNLFTDFVLTPIQ